MFVRSRPTSITLTFSGSLVGASSTCPCSPPSTHVSIGNNIEDDCRGHPMGLQLLAAGPQLRGERRVVAEGLGEPTLLKELLELQGHLHPSPQVEASLYTMRHALNACTASWFQCACSMLHALQLHAMACTCMPYTKRLCSALAHVLQTAEAATACCMPQSHTLHPWGLGWVEAGQAGNARTCASTCAATSS